MAGRTFWTGIMGRSIPLLCQRPRCAADARLGHLLAAASATDGRYDAAMPSRRAPPGASNRLQYHSAGMVLDLTRLVLASASPRRAELLSAAGIAFTVEPVDA